MLLINFVTKYYNNKYGIFIGVPVSDIDLMRPSLLSRFVTVEAVFSKHFQLFLIYEKLHKFIIPGYCIILINLSQVLILICEIIDCDKEIYRTI